MGTRTPNSQPDDVCLVGRKIPPRCAAANLSARLGRVRAGASSPLCPERRCENESLPAAGDMRPRGGSIQVNYGDATVITSWSREGTAEFLCLTRGFSPQGMPRAACRGSFQLPGQA